MSGVTDVGKSPFAKVLRSLLVMAGLWLLWENIKAGDSAWLFAFLDWAWAWILRGYEWATSR